MSCRMRYTAEDSFLSFETTPQSWLRQSSSPYTGEPSFFFCVEYVGFQKGQKPLLPISPKGIRERSGSRVSKYAGGIFVAEYEVRQHRLLGNAERFFRKYWRAQLGKAKQMKSISHTKRAETRIFLPFNCPLEYSSYGVLFLCLERCYFCKIY